MPIQTLFERNSLVTKYIADATHGALQSTVAAATAGTELTGGAPAYARKALAWAAAAASASTATQVVFDVAASLTVASVALFNALTVGTFIDAVNVTSQTFSSQGTYAVTPTITIT